MGNKTSSNNYSSTNIENIVSNNILNKTSFNATFDTTIKNNSKCKSSTNQRMKLSFGSVGGDFSLTNTKLEQKANVSLDCMQQSDVQLEMVNNLIKDSVNKFKSSNDTDIGKVMESVAKSQSLSTSNADSSNTSITNVKNNISNKINNIIENSIKNNINLENSKECVNQVNQQMEIEAGEVKGEVKIDKLDMVQQVDTFTKCMNVDGMIAKAQSEMNEKFGVVQDNESKTKMSESQKSKAETTGVIGDLGNAISGILNSLSGLLISAYLPFILMAIVAMYFMYIFSSGGSENSPLNKMINAGIQQQQNMNGYNSRQNMNSFKGSQNMNGVRGMQNRDMEMMHKNFQNFKQGASKQFDGVMKNGQQFTEQISKNVQKFGKNFKSNQFQ